MRHTTQTLTLATMAFALIATGCAAELTPELTQTNGDDASETTNVDTGDGTDSGTQTPTPAPKADDLDGDGYTADVDCNDSPDDADNDGKIDGFFVNPGMAELCDGIDNNCDGKVDEGVTLTVFRDADQDGYGSDAEGDSMQICQDADVPEGYVGQNGDCNDAFSDTNADGHVDGFFINPGVPEATENGVDDNCNGETDEQPDESAGDYANALTVTTPFDNAPIALTAQVYHKHSDLGAWWNPELSVEVTGSSATTEFTEDNDVANACGVRFNATITHKNGTKSWLCEGSGADAAVNWSVLNHASITIGNVTFDTAETTNNLEIYEAPEGGCSLVIVLDETGECSNQIIN